MSSPQIDTVLQELINQFSDPLAFLRELAQNAIDAGTQEVWIRLEYADGTARIFVEDWGEGMTRDIIENKLTRLFSSTKDDDYTKIGRFGIGFVSVFAMEPDLVVLDTARGGEKWRVLFHPNRTYELIRLNIPVEGTQIQILKKMARKDFETLKERARDVAQKWCRHARIPVMFEGEDVRQPFVVDTLIQTTYEEPGTRVVAGFSTELMAPFGFYNSGLTLSEGKGSEWPYLSFKIDSRYLEHTLTRDQILEDRHFHKVRALLDRLYKRDLPALLVARLEELALVEDSGEEHAELATIFTALVLSSKVFASAWESKKVFPTLDGEPLSIRDVQRLQSRNLVYFTRAGGHIAEHLKVRCLLRPEFFAEVFAMPGGRRVPSLENSWVFHRSVPSPPGFEELRHELLSLHPHHQFLCGALDYPISAIWLRELKPVARTEWLKHAEINPFSFPIVVINTRHHRVVKLLRIAQTEPEWAAYLFTKWLIVLNGWPVDKDDQLLRHVVSRREKRKMRHTKIM